MPATSRMHACTLLHITIHYLLLHIHYLSFVYTITYSLCTMVIIVIVMRSNNDSNINRY